MAACKGGDTGDGVASANGGAANGASASPSQSLDPRDAQLKFAQCMRENGVDMPDPDGSGRIEIKGKPGDRGKLQAAMQKCQHFMQAGGAARRLDDPKMRDQMLKFAQCMRQHGVDVPDPQPGEGIQMRVPKGDDAKFQAAQQACGQLFGGGKSTTRNDGSAGTTDGGKG
jgi:pyruvate/2-oxoglutarate dehydrogenase complex dihydrolipoamide acyltransferase (E2) component